MGLVLGIISIVVTIAITVLIMFGNGMSDAPTQPGISVWPTLIGGGLISAGLILSHYMHMTW